MMHSIGGRLPEIRDCICTISVVRHTPPQGSGAISGRLIFITEV
uniref:Uncharacterized protein n=1 Tax=Arundo donax TaxID=35708 RepID=A0A0A9H5P4_ARUDO